MFKIANFTFPHEASNLQRHLSICGIEAKLIEGSHLFLTSWEPPYTLYVDTVEEQQKALEILKTWTE
jgi:hypothetical protein